MFIVQTFGEYLIRGIPGLACCYTADFIKEVLAVVKPKMKLVFDIGLEKIYLGNRRHIKRARKSFR